MASNAPQGGWSLPWRDDWAHLHGKRESEFSWGNGLTPPGLEDAAPADGGRYRPTRASETLPHALSEGIPNDG